MSGACQGAVPYQWTDAEGSPLPLWCRVAQIAVDPQHGAMRCWLHQHGLVIGWDATWLHVCMDHYQTFVVLRAHLVRALTPPRRSR
jgi:hypothetical protein